MSSFSALQRAENSSIATALRTAALRLGFSALQRAENSSIKQHYVTSRNQHSVFQCSSASRKFLNRRCLRRWRRRRGCFSALQRAENSSIKPTSSASADCTCFSALQRAENSSMEFHRLSPQQKRRFQCSSASRKFLNADPRTCVHPYFRPR